MKNDRKVIVFIAASLDGYIATKDESLEWLFQVEGEGDNGYKEFYQTVDVVIMGKKTYNWVIEYERGEFPYKDKICYVFTRSVTKDKENIKFVNENVAQFIRNLKKQEGKDIWLVGGGELIYAFLKNDLVDELIITIAPVILGEGIALFKKGNYHKTLVIKGLRRFNQFVELHYEVSK